MAVAGANSVVVPPRTADEAVGMARFERENAAFPSSRRGRSTTPAMQFQPCGEFSYQ
jgi:hypothetical protein